MELEPEPGELTNVIAKLDESKVEQTIKEDAEADWESDYEMQPYQIDNQTKAIIAGTLNAHKRGLVVYTRPHKPQEIWRAWEDSNLRPTDQNSVVFDPG